MKPEKEIREKLKELKESYSPSVRLGSQRVPYSRLDFIGILEWVLED